MKLRTFTCIAAMTLFAALATTVRLAAQEQQQQQSASPKHYRLTVLGTLGGTVSVAQGGVNNRGQLAGFSSLPGDTAFYAFLWQHGVMTDLGSLPGSSISSTFANPNEKGEVSGFLNTAVLDPNGEDFCFDGTHLICLGFLWRDGVMTAMPTLGGNNSFAYMLNNRNQVVGVAETPTTDATCPAAYLEAKPVIWQDGTLQELPLISGDTDGFGYGINDRGQIVGATGACNQSVPFSSFHAVLWPNGPNGGVIDLGNFGGTTLNVAFYINNQGQIVGQAGVPGGANFHAFLWQKGVMTDMGTLPGDVQSWANNINSKSQAAGTSFDALGNGRAFIWQNGVMTDLNTLIPAGSPLYLLEAFGINDRGQISGYGVLSSGYVRGFLLNQCNEGEDGCGDNAEDTAAATQNGPASVSQRTGTMTPPNPALSGRGILDRFRARRFPWYSVPGPETGPAN